MSLRLGDLGGGQTRTWARPAGRRSPREKTGEANDPSQILGVVAGCCVLLFVPVRAAAALGAPPRPAVHEHGGALRL